MVSSEDGIAELDVVTAVGFLSTGPSVASTPLASFFFRLSFLNLFARPFRDAPLYGMLAGEGAPAACCIDSEVSRLDGGLALEAEGKEEVV